jgi:histidine triad (HIT) family protein
MPSLFSKICSGEIPAYKVAETGDFLAFLDVFPLVEGHVLVIPKLEVDNIFDLAPLLFKDLFGFAQTVAHGIERAIPCTKVGIAVIGLEVPHAHIHLVPINSADDLNFTRMKLKVSTEMLEATQQKILEALRK